MAPAADRVGEPLARRRVERSLPRPAAVFKFRRDTSRKPITGALHRPASPRPWSQRRAVRRAPGVTQNSAPPRMYAARRRTSGPECRPFGADAVLWITHPSGARNRWTPVGSIGKFAREGEESHQIPGGLRAPSPSSRCMSTVSSQRPCLRPTFLRVPTISKPAARWRRMDAGSSDSATIATI